MREITTMDQLRGLIPAPNEMAFAKLRERLCDQGIAFVERCPFLVLGTVGSWGLELSPKGGPPGFVEVVDDQTLLIPEFSGNRFALGVGNIVADPRVGLMLLRPATDEVLRISGRASLFHDAETCERLAVGGKPAVLVIRIDVDRAAFHCVRSARRAGLWDPGSWDEPTRISFGKIYAESLQQPELEEALDHRTEVSNSTLY